MTPKLLINSQTEQLDAEDEWLADYMAGRLSPERAKEFERRLVTDRQFFRRTAPFLSVLYPVEPTPIELEVRARVAARTAAMRQAKAERIERRRRRAALLGAAATTAFWVKAGAGFATAATVMVAVAQYELASVSAPPTPIFVHVMPTHPAHPAPILAAAPVRRRPSLAANTTPVIAEPVAPTLSDPALAGIDDSSPARVYFAPSAVTFPTDQGRIALNPATIWRGIDTLHAPRRSSWPQTVGGVVSGAVNSVLDFLRRKPSQTIPAPKPPTL